MNFLIDIGVNWHSKQLRPHRSALLARAREAGVSAILATGTSLATTEDAVALAAAEPGYVFATAGIHPHDASSWSDATERRIGDLLQSPFVVAAGEMGMDLDRNFSTPAEQRHAFSAQLALAEACKKPLFLHSRKAHDEVIAMLRPAVARGLTGVVHCFTGTLTEARQILDLGLDIGITGWVADLHRASDLRQALPKLPADRLHVETDAPYLQPRNMPGRASYNEPAYLSWVVKEIAELQGREPADVAAQCTANSKRLFKLP